MINHIQIEELLDRDTLRAPVPRNAFKGDTVHRVQFPAGLTMYKLTHASAVEPNRSIAPGTSGSVTPWWFSYESIEATSNDARVAIRGIADKVESAARASANLRQYLRSRGAVSYDWNVMTHLLVVELARGLSGLLGLCSGQPLFDDTGLGASRGTANVSFIGGEQQFFLPGLRRQDVSVSTFGPIT